jgi:large subunit ribosomal protein L21
MKYAIVENGGKQFRAVEGGTLEVDRLPVEAGAKDKLEQILLLADGENITVGTPLIKDVPVWTTVVEHFRGPKVNIFNYSPKKRIRVKIGHRQNYTRLLVDQIGGTEFVKKEPVIVEKAVEVEAEETAPKAKAEKPAKPVAKTAAKKPAATKKPVAKAAAKTAVKPSTKKTSTAKADTKKAPKKTTSPKGKAAPKKPAAKK